MSEVCQRRMTKAEYALYLQSDHWKDLRTRKLIQGKHRCLKCHSVHNLQVHHVEYRNIYDVTLDDLQVLCDECHRDAHGLLEKTIIDSNWYHQANNRMGKGERTKRRAAKKKFKRMKRKKQRLVTYRPSYNTHEYDKRIAFLRNTLQRQAPQ